ncbi:COMM domain-containing protein 9 [Geodia barretti]|uniref:COMM domain-containing protein 9 n=1 Tax=Geodia barretti TaxID=519541 RepID=A0AA35TDU3_GEOBA|nr:COMM domain-containing protein 9 [Geodia barretti]
MAQWSGLSCLLRVSSKEAVQNVLREAFSHRNESVPDVILASAAKNIQIEPLEAKELFSSACLLVSSVLQSGALDKESIETLFPDDFHNDLKGLLSEIIAESMCDWKRHAMTQQVSLPRLESFDWRVDVKISSTAAARMAVPTCLLQMKVDGGREDRRRVPVAQTVSVEFSPETLHTMLDGLGKIRDQLASVATK